jgi:hypothetical protein
MSVTVAFAADIASTALTLTLAVGSDPPLGSSARMTVSQNAIRKRNRMTCLSPCSLFVALEPTLAARLEAPVGDISRFFPVFVANEPRSFGKFDQSAFNSNPSDRISAANHGHNVRGPGPPLIRLSAGPIALRQPTIHHSRRMRWRKTVEVARKRARASLPGSCFSVRLSGL